jgi:uncharacterized protein YegL
MKLVPYSLAALLLGSAACSSDLGKLGDGKNMNPSTSGDGDKGGPGNGDGDTAPPITGDGDGDSSGGSGDGDGKNCEEHAVRADPSTADMLILLDRSGSMREEMRWEPSAAAMKAVTSKLESTIRFGLSLFPGDLGKGPCANDPDPVTCCQGQADPFTCVTDALGGGLGGGDGACDPGKLDVMIEANAAQDIKAAIDRTKPNGGTPTGGALENALKVFTDMPAPNPDEQPHTPYVLLVTDGQPTCDEGGGSMVNDTDINRAVSAIDALYAKGIATYVIGYDAQLDQSFQDTLTEFAQHGHTDHYRKVQNEQDLINEFTSITNSIASCAFNLDSEPSDPAKVEVKLDGKQLNLDKPDGFSISGKKVTVEGASCKTLQDGSQHTLSVVVKCADVPVI